MTDIKNDSTDGFLPDGWEIKRLEECFKLKSGDFLTSKMMSDNGKYPVFGGNGLAGLYNNFNISGNNVIIGRVGALCGNVRYIEENIWLTDNAFRIVDFKYEFDKTFLTYLLNFKNLREYARQAAQPVISNSSLKDLVLEFPKSLKEQKTIVAILDEAFRDIGKAKANAEQNLKNAKELFESFLQQIFETKGDDWEIKKLEEITSILGDGLHGTPKYTIDGDYYFINGNNLKDGIIKFKENTKRVSIDEYNKYKKNLTNRSVLVSINGTLGNLAFYNNEKIILGKSACYFNLLESVDKNFIKYLISSPYFLNYAHKESTGATIKNVSLKTMREFVVVLPPLTEQKTIVQKLDALSAETKKLEAIYQKKIADLDELKKSILQKVFTGQLKPKKEVVTV